MEYGNCVVAGASGFVGRYLVSHLKAVGKNVTAACRDKSHNLLFDSQGVNVVTIKDIASKSCWQPVLEGQDVVIHLANRAHIMRDDSTEPTSLFYKINVEGSVSLAQEAIASGVKRFIFLSSIKVSGEATFEQPFSHTDSPMPRDPYASSKWEAEQQLTKLCAGSSMELVIIRPPLIYGPAVKGNLASLKQLLNKTLPLPLASIRNQRDLISLGNLADLIRVCIDHPGAVSQTLLCCDGEAISTPQLFRYIAEAQKSPLWLFSFPVPLLSALAYLAGRREQFARLSGDLRVDMSHTQTTLNWSPPYSLEESMHWAFSEQESK